MNIAYLSEWDYWIREMKIKAGEWVEIFLDEDLENFTVWMEKDIRSIPGSLIIVKSPLDGSIPIRKLINRMKEEKQELYGHLALVDSKLQSLYSEKLGIDDSVPLINI